MLIFMIDFLLGITIYPNSSDLEIPESQQLFGEDISVDTNSLVIIISWCVSVYDQKNYHIAAATT